MFTKNQRLTISWYTALSKNEFEIIKSRATLTKFNYKSSNQQKSIWLQKQNFKQVCLLLSK